VIGTLTPIIRGWVNYHRTVSASHAFNDLDWMFHRERQWMTHAHPTKSWAWKARRYFDNETDTRRPLGLRCRALGRTPSKFAWFPIIRHVMVRGTASGRSVSPGVLGEAHRTGATRLNCGERKMPVDRRIDVRYAGSHSSMERSYYTTLIPRSQGGSEAYTNLAFCHLYCHQQLHSKRTHDA
jgi:RNA-directed DNA polymerase